MIWYQSFKDMPENPQKPEVEVIFCCFPTLLSRQLESFTILAGGCSQHEKASCVAITLDIGRSLDIDTWILKKNH